MILAQEVLQLFCSQGRFLIQNASQKREIVQPTIYRILPKFNQVIWLLYTICMHNIIISAQGVLQLFCSQVCSFIQNASQKRKIVQPTIYRILPKFNQVIWLLYTICMRNIIILAQGVLQLFCSQDCFFIQNASQKREIVQPTIYRILPKFNQVIWLLYTICMHNIIILAQGVLQLFCSQDCFFIQNASQKREIVQPTIYRILPKFNQISWLLYTICMHNIIILAQGHLWLKCLSLKSGIIQSNIHRIL